MRTRAHETSLSWLDPTPGHSAAVFRAAPPRLLRAPQFNSAHGRSRGGAAPGPSARFAGVRSNVRRFCAAMPAVVSWPKQRFDRPALVHRAIAFGDLFERQCEVEDLARIDLLVPHQFDQMGQKAAYGRGAAVEMD